VADRELSQLLDEIARAFARAVVSSMIEEQQRINEKPAAPDQALPRVEDRRNEECTAAWP
jgi:hypothetical protein